jgi:hypothetical protein
MIAMRSCGVSMHQTGCTRLLNKTFCAKRDIWWNKKFVTSFHKMLPTKKIIKKYMAFCKFWCTCNKIYFFKITYSSLTIINFPNDIVIQIECKKWQLDWGLLWHVCTISVWCTQILAKNVFDRPSMISLSKYKFSVI